MQKKKKKNSMQHWCREEKNWWKKKSTDYLPCVVKLNVAFGMQCSISFTAWNRFMPFKGAASNAMQFATMQCYALCSLHFYNNITISHCDLYHSILLGHRKKKSWPFYITQAQKTWKQTNWAACLQSVTQSFSRRTDGRGEFPLWHVLFSPRVK